MTEPTTPQGRYSRSATTGTSTGSGFEIATGTSTNSGLEAVAGTVTGTDGCSVTEANSYVRADSSVAGAGLVA